MPHSRYEYYEEHESREYLQADTRWPEYGSCAACGATMPKGDLEEVDGEKVCATCKREMRLMEEGKI